MEADLLVCLGGDRFLQVEQSILNARISVDGVPAKDHMPPWLALADLLVDPMAQIWTGITLRGGPDSIEMAKFIAEEVAHPAVQFRAPPLYQWPEYATWQRADNTHALNIVWASMAATAVEIAQLVDYWYYAETPDGPGRLLAYGVPSVRSLLTTYNLRLPRPNEMVTCRGR